MPTQPSLLAASGRTKGQPVLGVVLVDAPHVVRAGIRLLVAAQLDMEVLIDAGSADECLGALQGLRRRTGVAIVIGLGLRGDHDSNWLIRSIRERFPSMP